MSYDILGKAYTFMVEIHVEVGNKKHFYGSEMSNGNRKTLKLSPQI